MLILSYLRTQWDESFSKAELNENTLFSLKLNENVGLKSDIRAPASTVIDMAKVVWQKLAEV